MLRGGGGGGVVQPKTIIHRDEYFKVQFQNEISQNIMLSSSVVLLTFLVYI